MSAPVRFWRYEIPYDRATGDDGATIFVDSTGVFAAVGAYGAFAYHWSANNRRDCREFILDLSPDYAKDKLARGHRVFDGEATLASVVALAKRVGLSEDDLERLNDELEDEGSDFGSESDFDHWLHETRFMDRFDVSEVYGCREERFEAGLVAFVEKVLPRLAVLLRAELAAEGYFAGAGATT